MLKVMAFHWPAGMFLSHRALASPVAQSRTRFFGESQYRHGAAPPGAVSYPEIISWDYIMQFTECVCVYVCVSVFVLYLRVCMCVHLCMALCFVRTYVCVSFRCGPCLILCRTSNETSHIFPDMFVCQVVTSSMPFNLCLVKAIRRLQKSTCSQNHSIDV